jgi:hypothetical protein
VGTAGTFQIAIDHVNGFFLTSENIYLEDKLLNVTVDLRVAPYSFTTATGSFDDRFQLVYTQALGTSSTDFSPNSVIVYKNTDSFHVSTNGITMKEIQVFDILGRLIFKKSNINATTTVLTALTETKEVLFLKITSEDNVTVTVKIIN